MIKNLKKRLKDQRGLTLVELLAVIVILGIIAAIAVPSIGGIIQKSEEDAVKADAITILNAAKLYVASNGVDGATTTIDEDALAEYIDNEGSFTDEEYDVVYDGSTYELTSTNNITAGNKEIKFTNASLNDINDDTNHTEANDVITIGS